MSQTCDYCDGPASKRCTRCTKNWYCSQDCQRKSWPLHIFDCKRFEPIPTAYYLFKAAVEEEFPEHPQTRSDYGFTKTAISRDHTMLLGLYRGIFVYMSIDPKDVHRWRKQGILTQEIRRIYEEIPPANRGLYYPWFLQNQHLLDPSWKPSEDSGLVLMRQTWAFIGADPTVTSGHWDVVKTWPRHKQKCFELYHMSVHQWHPSPEFDAWVNFGFCVCPSTWDEQHLSRIYTNVILHHKCPLDDFATAYHSRLLFKLLGRYGLEEEAKGIQYLDHIIDCHGIESAWHLKAWVQQETLEPRIPSIRVDYGMMHCAGHAEHLQLLKNTYKKVFDHPQGDPIQLHQACIRGQTFEYVEGLVKIKKRHAKILQRLMKNPYPLQIPTHSLQPNNSEGNGWFWFEWARALLCKLLPFTLAFACLFGGIW